MVATLLYVRLQKRHFGKIMGTDGTSGLVFPNFNKVINAFGFDCYTCVTLKELDNALSLTADSQSPLFFELIVEPNSELLPKCGVTLKKQALSLIPWRTWTLY